MTKQFKTVHQFIKFKSYEMAVWRSGNDVGRIYEVALRRARLVVGWVNRFGM